MDGETGSAVLMDAKNGQIYAMANLPSFDPNLFWKADNYERKNRVTDEILQLGGLSDFFHVGAEIYNGNRYEYETFSTEEIAKRIIEPRKLKKILSVRGGGRSSWQKWGNGDYVAPVMNWPNGFRGTTKENSQFCQEIGLHNTKYLSDKRWQSSSGANDSKKCDVTDPEFDVTLMGLTNGFSQLVNGGFRLQPQIVKSLWVDQEERMIDLDVGGQEIGIGEPASKSITAFLKSHYPPGDRDLIFVESLNIQNVTPDEVVVDDEFATKKDDEIIVEETPLHETRGKSILLGGELKGDRQLVLGLLIEGGRLSINELSPFRKFGYEVINKGKKILKKNKINSGNKPKELGYDEAFRKWSKGQSAGSLQRVTRKKQEKQNVMPDLKALSLRKALQAVNGFNLSISMQGAGRVIRQSIKPGSKVKSEQKLILELSMDH